MVYRYYPINILVCFIILSTATGQQTEFNEKEFFSELSNSYYTLNETQLNNFSALVTSLKMEIFAEDVWENEEIFPLQLIWFKPDKIYLAQQGVPTIKENRYKEYQEIIDGIKFQIEVILPYLKRFYILGLYESIPNNYDIKVEEELVWITAIRNQDSLMDSTIYKMGRNGLCLNIEIHYPAENENIIITPSFNIIKTKWLCNGWIVQRLIGNSVINAYVLEIEYGEYQSFWFPVEIKMNIQKANDPDTYYDIIKFRNYLFNQPIQLEEGANLNH